MINAKEIREEMREVEIALLDALTQLDQMVGIVGELTNVKTELESARRELRELRQQQSE